VWLIGRILVDDSAADLDAVRALQAELRLTRTDGSDAAMRVDTCLDGRSAAIPPAPLFLSTVDAALRRNPVPQGESLLWPLEAAAVQTMLPEVYEALRRQDQPRALGNGWALPVSVRTHWGHDALTRARVARNLIGALGIDEAMYPTAEVDAEGHPLHGSAAYELRFARGAVRHH